MLLSKLIFLIMYRIGTIKVLLLFSAVYDRHMFQLLTLVTYRTVLKENFNQAVMISCFTFVRFINAGLSPEGKIYQQNLHT
jgi:hypothetical protein